MQCSHTKGNSIEILKDILQGYANDVYLINNNDKSIVSYTSC